MTADRPVSVLFVCLGNICRSPLAEGIFRAQVFERGLDAQFLIDSAGTGSWHVGNPPHPGSIAVAHSHGIDIQGQRARQVSPEDLQDFDWIVAMDASNVRNLRRMVDAESSCRVVRLLEYVPNAPIDVPDPYYEGGFESVFELIEAGCRGLLEALVTED